MFEMRTFYSLYYITKTMGDASASPEKFLNFEIMKNILI